MLLSKYEVLFNNLLIRLTTTPTPTQVPEKKFPYLNSATSDVSVGEYDYGALGKWIVDGLAYFGEKLLYYLDPIVSWGGRIVIVSCFIIYYCSGERKYIAAGLKWLIVVVVFWSLRGALG